MILLFQIYFIGSTIFQIGKEAVKYGQSVPRTVWDWETVISMLISLFGLWVVGFFNQFEAPQIIYCILMILGMIEITKDTFHPKPSKRKYDPYYALFIAVIVQLIYYYGGVYKTLFQ